MALNVLEAWTGNALLWPGTVPDWVLTVVTAVSTVTFRVIGPIGSSRSVNTTLVPGRKKKPATAIAATSNNDETSRTPRGKPFLAGAGATAGRPLVTRVAPLLPI